MLAVDRGLFDFPLNVDRNKLHRSEFPLSSVALLHKQLLFFSTQTKHPERVQKSLHRLLRNTTFIVFLCTKQTGQRVGS